MDWIFPLLLTVHTIVALCIIGLVLMQHGKGADLGAAFGSGASGSLFGATGSANFLSRTTAILTAVFFATSLTLTYLASDKPAAPQSLMESVETPATPAVPSTADKIDAIENPAAESAPAPAPQGEAAIPE